MTTLARQVLAEFLGTFTLIIFGVAVVAQVVLSDKSTGDFLSINMGWGLAVTFGVYVAGGVSGAHLNPAVTLALAVWRGFSWRFVVPFVLAQTLGAFVASMLVYYTYIDALTAYESQLVSSQRAEAPSDGQHLLETASIWATYPAPHLKPIRGGLVDQIVGTGLLLMCIFALTDQRNLAPHARIAPLLVGSSVFLIGMTFGFNCGYAINPARDFGPRLFTFLWGWGPAVFTSHNGFWWVPIVGPCIGGILGGAVYDLLIKRWHPSTEEEKG